MLYLKTYENWTFYNEVLDEILDKINKSGFDSLDNLEKDFLKAWDNKVEMNRILTLMKQQTFTDKYFTFKLKSIEDFGEEKYYYGTITVPDLEFGNNKRLSGELEGYILKVGEQLIPYFEREGYDILEYCNGLEYELDNFLEYVVNTIEDEKTVG